MNLDLLRKEIDSIDSDLADALQRRMKIVSEIGEIKKENNLPVTDSSREQEVLEKVSAVCYPAYREDICKIFSEIISTSRSRQEERFTRRFGLLGEKLDHSISPLIHGYLGNYSYKCYPTERKNLDAFFSSEKLNGFNVTIPYKQEAFRRCGSVSETAEKTGAVNTVLRLPDGSLYGDNTDVYGFEAALERNSVSLSGKKVIVLGSGGAGKTARYAAQKQGASEVITVSRTGSENYENIYRHKDADVLINATPVGMFPGNGSAPIDVSSFENLEFVFDMIYNPRKTRLLSDAERNGIKCSDGLYMLVAQAVRSAELFGGVKPDTDITGMLYREICRRFENIILIGMPGCGKTSAGKILAEKTGKIFTDTDEIIEKISGETTEKILRERGEDFFRETETSVIKTAGAESGYVIATGGGCVTRKENLAALKQNGTVIYIKRPVTELDIEARPLSQQTGGAEALYKQRKALYESFADITVSAGRNPAETALIILSALTDRE